MLNRIICATVIVLLGFSSASGTLRASKSVDDYRNIGSVRKYIFNMQEKEVGKLESTFDGKEKIAGKSAYRFSEKLNLDFSSFGQDYVLEINNRHFVNTNGFYVGDSMSLKMNGQPQSLYLLTGSKSVNGFFTLNDQRQDIEFFMEPPFYAIDNNMIDQYECYLAMHDIRIGDTLLDTIFVPQSNYRAVVRVAIEDYKLIEYGELFDSAFVCHFIQPTEQLVYFTKTKKIIKVSQPSQKMDIVLIESALDQLGPRKRGMDFSDFFWRLPLYLVYLAVGLIFAIPFLRKYYRRPEIYMLLILGGIFYPIVNFTQLPLQKWFVDNYMIPGIRGGGSIYYYAVYSVIITAIIQEILKIVPLAIIYFIKRPRQNLTIALGALCGIGFGIMEASSLTGAAYQSGSIGIFSLVVYERVLTILFHAISGAFFGYAITRNAARLMLAWIVIVIIHSLSNYLLIFVQRKIIDIGLLEFIITIIYLVLLMAVYLIIRKHSRR